MACAEHVILRLAPHTKAGKAAGGADRHHAIPAACQNLMDVTLMAHVPDDSVAGHVENAVQREGQFDDAEIRSEVPAVLRARSDQQLADLLGEDIDLGAGEPAEIAGRFDSLYDHKRGSLDAGRPEPPPIV